MYKTNGFGVIAAFMPKLCTCMRVTLAYTISSQTKADTTIQNWNSQHLFLFVCWKCKIPLDDAWSVMLWKSVHLKVQSYYTIIYGKFWPEISQANLQS